ncbi:MAG: class I SAM-dependent methyltransferase [Polyangiaceae bacterium]
MTSQNHYTFGDGERAARRLELLARVYEPSSRALIERFRPASSELALALDLGAGPGHTTRLVHEVSQAKRTIGLEASSRYLAASREHASDGIEFMQEDVTAPTEAVPPAGLVFCRFVLTHLADPAAAIRGFRKLVEAGGVLLLQEMASMQSAHPALSRYYELVGQLQAHYGQTLYIGRQLQRLAVGAPFRVLHSGVQHFEQPAATMAELHLQNLRTWRSDSFAVSAFGGTELDRLDAQLQAIVSGEERVAPVALGLAELALQ